MREAAKRHPEQSAAESKDEKAVKLRDTIKELRTKEFLFS
jgi:hypothetical protein